ncbi:pyridoxal phosphate-dependent aminotransferase [Marinovum sp.]|uniref:pyridoxal phosphate-dependent aminotransferase n=1 Tax=Marinovum sp. TaxID=2024839 RepID=UPI002B264973|nr:pyridoxal phosphate-dependent aminotransferase [Marinovum sp.]
MRGPRFTPIVQALPATVPFVGPEQMERDRGAPFAARLGANESVFGPSPQALAALQASAGEIWKYPDSTSFELRHALADDLGVAPENIVVGAGIDGLLDSTVRLMVGTGDHVVTSDGAYPTFNFHVAGYGGTLHKVPYRDDHEDPDALLAKAHEVGAKLVYLSNPDNPMGTWLSAERIEAMIAALPEGCVLVLDEAYVEFAPADAVPALDVTDPAVLRFRTFSKAHGMAGARVGYALGRSDVIAAYEKVRNHFGMNRSAQIGALAALRDHDWLAHVQSAVVAARESIAAIARDNGLVPIPSATNFVAVDCGGDGDFARRVLGALVARGVFVRMPFVAPEDRCIRISAGPPEMLDALAAALPQALEAARNG